MLLTGIEPYHMPVMVPETLEQLAVQAGGRYLDATCGEGGHSRAILRAAQPGGQVAGIDADHEAISVANIRLREFEDSFIGLNVNFRELRQTLLELNFVPLHGVLFDLGVSSLQLDAEKRGFSFRRPDPLDMRFSIHQTLTASDIVNSFAEHEIASIIFQFGEDSGSRRIAKTIVRNRPIRTSLQLAEVISSTMPRKMGNKHPATRTFQALRIAVNNELSALEAALEQAVSLLGKNGRLVVLSYHSLEDRIVKSFFRRESSDCICPPGTPECFCDHTAVIKRLTSRPIAPTAAEVKANIRSRSAKLRSAMRL